MSIPCPRVAGSVADFGAEHPDKYRDCTALPLRRHWQAPDAMPVEGGRALVGAAEPFSIRRDFGGFSIGLPAIHALIAFP